MRQNRNQLIHLHGWKALWILLLCSGLAACSAVGVPNTGSAAGNPGMTPTTEMATASAPATVSPARTAPAGPHVTISNFTFGPDTLTVDVGTTVTWINQDDTAHTVTSVDKVFNSPGLDTGDPFSFTFTKAGTYAYFCSIHPMMQGKIIVK